MLPLSDGIPARRFPVVNILLIVANFAVFILYELPHLNAAHSADPGPGGPGRTLAAMALPGVAPATGGADLPCIRYSQY